MVIPFLFIVVVVECCSHAYRPRMAALAFGGCRVLFSRLQAAHGGPGVLRLLLRFRKLE